MKKTLSRAGRLYRSRVDAGLCGRCGGFRPDDKTLCPECAKILAQNQKKYRERKQAAGLCVVGGCKKDAAPGRSHCQDHTVLASKATSEKRRLRKQAGLCTECGKKVVTDSYHCPAHRGRNSNVVVALPGRR